MSFINRSSAIFIVLLVVGIVLNLPVYGLLQEEVYREAILDLEAWKTVYDAYKCDRSLIEKVRANLSDKLRIDVYLGFWCRDSVNNVPKFLKIIDSLQGEGLKVRYFSVPRKSSGEDKYFVETVKVERVPTFIFYCDTDEIGRIVENPEKDMLSDFLDILLKKEH